jgi:GNAT superfamily N-acetyltransferase
MSTNETIAIRLLAASESRDTHLVDHLTDLINRVYEVAEAGLWRDGTTRTTASELAELIRAQEIAVATRSGQIAGAVRIHDVRDDVSEFGMLVAAPEQRGTGVGRALVAFAEQRSRERGLRAIQLELLLPRTWQHPTKEFLKAWYGRIGYRPVRTGSMDDAYPHLAPLLATPCHLAVYEKPLETHGNVAHSSPPHERATSPAPRSPRPADAERSDPRIARDATRATMRSAFGSRSARRS